MWSTLQEMYRDGAAGREFVVNESLIRYWRKQKSKSVSRANKSVRHFCDPKYAKCPVTESNEISGENSK